MTRYMVIETFRQGPDPVYERFAKNGRMLVEGLYFIDSWLSADGSTCYQLMQTQDVETFDKWMPHWSDLVAFEIIRLGEKPDLGQQLGDSNDT